jgi:hypothetical protein
MKYTKQENTFILKWAKKIRLINLLGGECKKCKTKDVFLLEFHHKGDKEANINSLILGRWDKILKEGEKCDILCRNCHVEYHADISGRHLKTKESFLKDNVCCKKCNYRGDNLASLEFHHKNPDEKSFMISDVFNRNIKVSAEDLDRELSLCEILCRNCHGMELINVKRFKKFEKEILRRSKEHKSLFPVDKSKIIKLMKEGKKQIEIARELRCAKSTVSETLKKYRESN